MPVAFGLAVTLPGIPVVWAGDEFGLTGVDGEASRTPIPWSTSSPTRWHRCSSCTARCCACAATHPVLATGGIRWLAVGDDAVAFVRESSDESVLVFAARSAAALEFASAALVGTGAIAPVFGSAVLEASGEVVRVSTDEPVFAVWRLPGVAAPAW